MSAAFTGARAISRDDPREGELPRGDVVLLRNDAELVDKLEIVGEVLAGQAGYVEPDVGLGEVIARFEPV